MSDDNNVPKRPNAAQPLSGDETMFIIQDRRGRRISFENLVDQLHLNRRIEEITLKTGETYTFEEAFEDIPIVVPVAGWIDNQRVEAYVIELTPTYIKVGAKKTNASLLASASPYGNAANGTTVKIVLIER